MNNKEQNKNQKPSKSEAEEAVRTLIRWAGDDPNRKGLLETPQRVVNSYLEFFKGYEMSINSKIAKTFDNTENYDDIIMLRDIRVESVCEHHMVPIIGKATIGYIPNSKIIGLSKLARIVDMFAKRLQLQERMVIEIAQTLNEILEPKGVGVVIESSHQCMTTRGVHKTDAMMRTMHFTGVFKEKSNRSEFLELK